MFPSFNQLTKYFLENRILLLIVGLEYNKNFKIGLNDNLAVEASVNLFLASLREGKMF